MFRLKFGVSLKRFGGSLKMCVEFGISVKSGVSFNTFGEEFGVSFKKFGGSLKKVGVEFGISVKF